MRDMVSFRSIGLAGAFGALVAAPVATALLALPHVSWPALPRAAALTAPPPPAASSPPPTGVGGAVQLRVGSAPTSLEPLTADDPTAIVLAGLMYDPIVLDGKSAVIDRAEAIGLSSTVLYIDGGAQFTDGTPVRGEDICASIDALDRAPALAERYTAAQSALDGCEAGSNSATVHFAAGVRPSLEWLAIPLRSRTGDLVGTGPYRCEAIPGGADCTAVDGPNHTPVYSRIHITTEEAGELTGRVWFDARVEGLNDAWVRRSVGRGLDRVRLCKAAFPSGPCAAAVQMTMSELDDTQNLEPLLGTGRSLAVAADPKLPNGRLLADELVKQLRDMGIGAHVHTYVGDEWGAIWRGEETDIDIAIGETAPGEDRPDWPGTVVWRHTPMVELELATYHGSFDEPRLNSL